MTLSKSHESKVMSSIKSSIYHHTFGSKWEGFSCANHPSFHGFAILSVLCMHVSVMTVVESHSEADEIQ